MKLSLIYEGISINPQTGDIAFDFQNDQPDDIVKFFEGTPLVHELGNGIYAGFIFDKTSPEIQSHEREKTAISLAKAYRNFRNQYAALIDKHGIKSINGIQISDRRAFLTELNNLASYKQLKKLLGIKLEDAIKSGGTNIVRVTTSILDLIDDQYDLDLVKQYIVGDLELPTRGATTNKTRITDLKAAYERVKNRIITALNQSVRGDEEIEHFVYFAAERLVAYNGFGFKPDVIVRPRSGSNLLRNFADMVSTEMGIPAVEGLAKSRANITYNDNGETIVIINSSGQVNPDLDDNTWIGGHITMKKMANKIATGSFKITHLYPKNRSKLQGLFKALPKLNELLTSKPGLNVLMVDDSIFSGTTQREMMAMMKQLKVGNIASYAVVKT